MKNARKNIIIACAAAAFAVACLAILLMSGVFKKAKHISVDTLPTLTPVPTVAPTPEPTATPVVKNTITTYRNGMVLTGDKLSFGLASSGMLSFIGSNAGQAYCYDWKNVIRIAGNSIATVGLTADGKVLISTGDEELSKAVSEWHDIVDIAVSDTVVYGLSTDGKVLSTDGSADGLMYVRKIAAGGDFLIAVDVSGEMLTCGNAPDVSVFEGQELVEIAAGTAHVVALTAEGTLLTTENGSILSECDGIQHILASHDDTAIINSDGTLHTNCEFIDAPIENAVGFSCGYGHALVLLNDGTVLAFGDNEYMQCEVSNWRLLPYMDERGYILGIQVGETDEDGNTIKTGDAYTLADGTEGIAVILGDIDMNGVIDTGDLTLLDSYIAGEAELSEVQMQSANLLRDASNPDSIDVADLEQLQYHLNGYTIIDQYAREFTYSGEVADAERFNADTVGYISLDNTRIVYPIMYGENFYYHYHNPAGVATSRSSIYLYYSHPTKNIVVTGHNLRASGLMLHDLHKLQDNYAPNYGKFKNRIWTVNVFGETHYWEVFAMYEEKPSNKSASSQYYNTNYSYTMDSMTDDEIRDWIDYQLERTELDYTLPVTVNDQFMTVLTCSDRHAESDLGGRIYFFLRRMDGH